MGDVNLLSNHGLALVCVARDRGSRLRDIADCIGITERATQRIVDELVQAGYITRIREGNRNRYEVQPQTPMTHPVLQDHWAGELLAVLVAGRDHLDAPSRAGREMADQAADTATEPAADGLGGHQQPMRA